MKPLGPEHNRKVLRHLHDRGIEMTPDELDAERKAAFATIRAELRKRGYTVPDDDAGLFLMMKKTLGDRKI